MKLLPIMPDHPYVFVKNGPKRKESCTCPSWVTDKPVAYHEKDCPQFKEWRKEQKPPPEQPPVEPEGVPSEEPEPLSGTEP